MNTLMLILGLVFVVAFVVYSKKVSTKTYNTKAKTILAATVAPVVILSLAIYTIASFAVKTGTRNAMVNDPTILQDTIKRLEEVEKENQLKASKEAVKQITEEDKKYAPVVGNPNGKVVIYEFFDYNCGYCKRGDAALREVLKSEQDVKVILKAFPIFPPSQIPAKAIVAAQMQGKAEALHELLFTSKLVPETNDKASENNTNEQIKAIVLGLAKKAGLDVDQLKKDMESPTVEEELLRTRQLASKLGIQGTPAFIIGDRFIPGYIDGQAMIELINSAK